LIIGHKFDVVFLTHSGLLILKFGTPYVEHTVCKRMRCDITACSKSSDISAFRLNIAVAWICHLNVSLNSGDTDFCVYAKENGQPWMLKFESSSHMNHLNCFSCCSVC